MKIIQVIVFAVCLIAATAGVNAKLRRTAPLTADASVVKQSVNFVGVGKNGAGAADKLLHLLFEDEKEAKKEEAKKESKADEEEEEDSELQAFLPACLVHTAEVVQ